jgi:hypothetical protein
LNTDLHPDLARAEYQSPTSNETSVGAELAGHSGGRGGRGEWRSLTISDLPRLRGASTRPSRTPWNRGGCTKAASRQMAGIRIAGSA